MDLHDDKYMCIVFLCSVQSDCVTEVFCLFELPLKQMNLFTSRSDWLTVRSVVTCSFYCHHLLFYWISCTHKLLWTEQTAILLQLVASIHAPKWQYPKCLCMQVLGHIKGTMKWFLNFFLLSLSSQLNSQLGRDVLGHRVQNSKLHLCHLSKPRNSFTSDYTGCLK